MTVVLYLILSFLISTRVILIESGTYLNPFQSYPTDNHIPHSWIVLSQKGTLVFELVIVISLESKCHSVSWIS